MSTQRNAGALIGGAILIALGIMSLLSQFFRGLDFWSFIWPFFIIGSGGLFFLGMFAGGKSVSGLAVPATIITTIGLILLYQNLSGHWESWSYAWTVIIIAVGLGIYIMGAYAGDESQRRSGAGVMKVGLILFILFGAFFEMIFSGGGLRELFFPIALILLGLYLIIKRFLPNKTQ